MDQGSSGGITDRTAPPGATDWKRILALLDRALDLDGDEREAWLDAQAGADADALRKLLDSRDVLETSDFLARNPPASTPVAVASVEPDDDQRVGPYRLLREIGRGGTATVWLAERADGLIEREVALKRPDMHAQRSPGFAERMARERRILASLSHPNIARLLDAGIEADGRPYLALEYVDGLAIDAYANRHRLTIRQRVTLLRDVARAVAYAHGQLVIHRDLKPSNLLVDARGTVHLVDFGIAKLIDPGPEMSADGSPLTMLVGRPLTPDYASPEQVRGETIATGSDIYSLGVVAYELLTGTRPYRLDGADAGAFARALERVDVARPSSVGGDAERTRQLRGDLDAIVMRMLAARPSDRYATMDALADDLDRHLDGQPVQARVASRGYVFRRWIARHKIESGLVLVLLLALLGGAYAQVAVAIAIGIGVLLALWQRDRALQQAALARAALERGEEVKRFIASIFTQAVPRVGQGGAVAATDLLKAAARRLETDLVGQPAVAAELAILIGTSLTDLGDTQAAAAWWPKAVDLAMRAFGPTHPQSLVARRRWIEAANAYGDIAVSYEQLPALLRDLRVARPAQVDLLTQSLQSHAFIETKRGHEQEAYAALREAIAVGVEHAGEASELALSARCSLSNTMMHFHRYPQALDAIAPALAPVYAMHGAERPHPLLTAVERCQGDALAHNQRPREATLVLQQVLADQKALDAGETARVRLATTFLARAYMHRGHLAEGHRLFVESLALHERLTGGINAEANGLGMWVSLSCSLLGDGERAIRELDRAEARIGPVAGGEINDAMRHVARAFAQATAGRADAALATMALVTAIAPRLSPTLQLRLKRVEAMALRTSGRAAEALAIATAALQAVDPACLALEHGLTWVEGARCQIALGRHDEAKAHWRRAVATWDDGQVDGDDVRAPYLKEFAALL